MNKKILALMALLLSLTGMVFAQQRTSLNIEINVPGAQVYINGRLAGNGTPNFSQLVPAGRYQVRVQLNGYKTFEQIVTVTNRAVTVPVVLEPLGGTPTPTPTPTPVPVVTNYTLTIDANITGADVIINGANTGKTPLNILVPAGSYTITFKAPGYIDETVTTSVAQNTRVSANLKPALVPLSLTGLINGAQIIINGQVVATATGRDLTLQVAPGTYTITIRIRNFPDITLQITAGAATTPVAVILPATIRVNVPANALNPEFRAQLASQVTLWVDGVKQRDLTATVNPGQRTIRITGGPFMYEVIGNFESGREYTLEPIGSINIR